MAKKISQLTAVTLPALTDQFEVNQGGVSKSATLSQVRAHEVFNVRDYGALGVNPTTDTATIQAAIDATVASDRRGGVVYIPRGQFNINATLTVPMPYGGFQQSISILGESAQTTKLNWVGASAGFVPMIDYLGQNVARVGRMTLLNGTGAGRAETVGLWFRSDPPTSGTHGGSSIFEHLLCSGFSRGVICGDVVGAISEVVFIQCLFSNNDFGVRLVGANSLDFTFIMPQFTGNGVGIDTISAGCVQVYGGAATGNDLDVRLNVGGGVISGFRSENADMFLDLDTGSATVEGCTVTSPASVDKVAIETRGDLTVLGSWIEGKITCAPRENVTLMGTWLGNGGDAGLHMLYPTVAGVTLAGAHLTAFGNRRVNALNGIGTFPNRQSVFDASNVEHGVMQDTMVSASPEVLVPTGAMLFQPQAAHPTAAVLGSGTSLYTKGGKLVIPYSNAGVLTFLTIPLDGSTVAWTQTTTPP